MATASDDQTTALVKAFATFKSSRRALEELLKAVGHAYDGLQEVLDRVEGTRLGNVRNLLLDNDERAKITRVFHDPSIVFVGQTNAGKSSLINEVLGMTVVKADDIPCTARIVHLAYGSNDTPEVEIRNRDGGLIEKKTMNKNYIPSGVANLVDPEDRENKDLVESKVFAKIKNPFLESGVTIIDSPGKNESGELDALVDKQMNSVLPLIVYVIDGKSLLSRPDIEAIGCLYRTVPEGNIFFVVTKCDPADKEVESSDEEEEEDEASDPTKPCPVEMKIRDTVYKKLVDNRFLDDVPMSQCKNYHALSSRKVKEYRWALTASSQTEETKQTIQNCKRYFDDFQRFKSCLLEFTRKQLIRSVSDATLILQTSLMKCLDYFIDQSNEIFFEKLDNDKNLKLIEMEESLLSQLLQSLVKSATAEFTDAVKIVVDRNRDNIIKMSSEFRFVQYQVPTDGFIAVSAVEQYKSELRRNILDKVGELIHREVMGKCDKIDEVFENVSKKVKDVQKKIGDEIPIHDALQEMFIGNYKFNIYDASLKRSVWQSIKRALVGFIGLITLKPLIQKIKGVNVSEKKWKENVAKEVLEVIHPDDVASVIIKGIVDHIGKGHENFLKRLNDLRELYEKSHMLGERDRVLIRKMSPIIARLQLTAWHIMDRLHFGEITYGKVRGKGAQGVVQDCDATGPNGELCVAKIIKVENEAEMGEIALEIHYTRKFNHPNIANVFGTIYEPLSDNAYELSIIMPRLERDLLVALPNLPDIRTKMKIAMQVARALEYLHDRGMMHRDIKAANVLLDAQNVAKITDFGLCKPPGISDISFVGTPVHMAPEIIKQQLYSAKVDVYAFGILLWYICEGNGNHPRYVLAHHAVQGLLVETAIGRRPERLPSFREDCWNLMEKCWRDEPHLRPDMKQVIEDLGSIMLEL